MADDWQLEAVHEQLKVFKSIKQPYQTINPFLVPSAVTQVINDHLLVNDQRGFYNHETLAQITKKLKEYFGGKEEIKLCFVVIVTNEDVNDRLTKIPVFTVIESENKRIYIDLSCSVYKSWDAFIHHSCVSASNKLCFPVNGVYDVGKKLKIDFSVRKDFFSWRKLMLWGGVFVGSATIAASFFFKIPASIFSCLNLLKDVAEEYCPGFSGAVSLVEEILKLIGNYRETRSFERVAPQLINIFKSINRLHLDTFNELWEDVKHILGKVSKFLSQTFSSFFGTDTGGNTPGSQHMLAITNGIDSKVVEITREASEQLKHLEKSNNSNQDGDFRETEMNVMVASMTVEDKNSLYFQKIFENCRNDNALQYGVNGKKQELDVITYRLIETTNSFVDKNNCKSEYDIATLLTVVSQLVAEEYKRKIKDYKKNVSAAKAAAGHPINLKAFNKSLAIDGNPEKHYWSEAMEYIMQSLYSDLKIFNKMKTEVLNNQGIVMHQVMKIPGKSVNMGLFKCNGVRKKGKFSAENVLSAVKKQIHFNEDDVAIKEKGNLMVIDCGTLTISVYQEIDGDNNSEGFALIYDSSDN